jgi:hypothetical protein
MEILQRSLKDKEGATKLKGTLKPSRRKSG